MIFKKTLPMLCVFDVQDKQIYSLQYTYDEAKDAASKLYRSRPCDIMLVVRNDHGRIIGVQEMTRREKAECGPWRLKWEIRPEDIVHDKKKQAETQARDLHKHTPEWSRS